MRPHVVVVACAIVIACSRRDDRVSPPEASPNDTVPVLVGAGDIADCQSDGAERTARLLDSIRGQVFVAGDAGYSSKRIPNAFSACYAPTWGRHRARTHPTLGNHDYEYGPDAYFDYFGDRAGPRPHGYYSFDVGRWHVLALNTNIPTASGSAQDAWIRADLTAHLGQCTLAFMHHPRFSSGPHTERDSVLSLWRTLAQYGVSLAIAGHDHLYERFGPLDPDGNADTVRGIRQFVVGTGGASHYVFHTILPGSEARANDTFGVLKLTLLPDRYQWEFIPIDSTGFRDRGESACRVTHAAD
jgi:hypothetical protein